MLAACAEGNSPKSENQSGFGDNDGDDENDAAEPAIGLDGGGERDAKAREAGSRNLDAADPGRGGELDSSLPPFAPPDVKDGGAEPPAVEPANAPGCGQTQLYQLPADPAARGPWPVGTRTVTLPLSEPPGGLTVEVWYPAKFGSSAGKQRKVYDLRSFLKESQRSKIPDEKAVSDAFNCRCYAGLPLDDAHGPYPIVFYIHGSASMRVASLSQMTHWASRGFVVVAADHPGLALADMLHAVPDLIRENCTSDVRNPQDVPRDLALMQSAIASQAGDLAFLAGRVDLTRIALAGHDQGATNVAALADQSNVQLAIMLGGFDTVRAGAERRSLLFLGGNRDSLATLALQDAAYEASPAPKRQVVIDNAEHLVATDLCGARNVDGMDPLQVASEYGVCGVDFARSLWKCGDQYLSQAQGAAITSYASAAALEERLQCADRSAAFAGLTARFPEVASVREQLQ